MVCRAGRRCVPYARRALYTDLTIAVYDELRNPVPDAQVVVTAAGRQWRVPLDGDGIGRFEYPLFWGPAEATVNIQHKQFNVDRPIARNGDRFPDLALGVLVGN